MSATSVYSVSAAQYPVALQEFILGYPDMVGTTMTAAGACFVAHYVFRIVSSTMLHFTPNVWLQ